MWFPLNCRVCNVIWEGIQRGTETKQIILQLCVVSWWVIARKIITGGKFYVHSHQDHLWSNYILTVFLYKIKSTQSLSTCLSIFWSSCYMIEIARIKIEAEERNNWSAHKGCTLQPIFISPQFVRHWVWFESEKKKQQKEKNRLLEASLGRNQLRQRFRSWEPASLEPRSNSCRAATSREFNSCPYSVSHFSHNKGRNRSSRGLVSSSKIKTLPRNRSSLCFADFDTRGRI